MLVARGVETGSYSYIRVGKSEYVAWKTVRMDDTGGGPLCIPHVSAMKVVPAGPCTRLIAAEPYFRAMLSAEIGVARKRPDSRWDVRTNSCGPSRSPVVVR